MERIGEVTAVRGDEVEITFCRPADCGRCHACSGNRAQTTILLKGSAQCGDSAVVDMPDGKVMKASALAYVLPCAGLLGGLALGTALFGNDSVGFACGLGGLAAMLLVVFVSEKKRRADTAWQPKLVRVIPREQASNADTP